MTVASEYRPEAENNLLRMIADLQDIREYQESTGRSFSEYLDIVQSDPDVCRNAYQRMYDMIMHFRPRNTPSTKPGSSYSSSTIPSTTEKTRCCRRPS